MRIEIVTLFPGILQGALEESLLKRAQERGLLQISCQPLRSFGLGQHQVVDDYTYGGGSGMVLRPEPLFAAVEALIAQAKTDGSASAEQPWVILLTPQGQTFTQAKAAELARRPWLILLCGRYEGVDERVREHLAHEEISIGDYVLSGGEVPALAVIEAVARLLPGFLGSSEGTQEESYTQGLLEYPQYTRPAEFRGYQVPAVLLSGHHAEIARWRRQQALLRTRQRRPELLLKAPLALEERDWLEQQSAATMPKAEPGG